MGRIGSRGIMLGGLAIVLSACAYEQMNETPIVLSYDGLTPIDDTLMTQVWVREGYSLADYRKVMLVGADIQYRPIKPDAVAEFPLSEEQKREFEDLITEEFDKALERLTLPEVTERGPDVLLVRGTMLDVVSKVPPEGSTSEANQLDSVGQATFVVELIDSQSNSVLVRALDTRAAVVPGQAGRSQADASREAVRLLITRWANMLVDALNELTLEDESQGA